MLHPDLLHLEPLPLWQATADPDLCRRHSNTQRKVWLSLCGVSWCTRFCLIPLSISGRYGVWFQMWFLPLLPSCWGFSFALGHGVSFFGEIQHFPINGCSAASCNFGILPGEDECRSFYSAILAQIIEIDQKHVGVAQGVVRRLKVILGI